MSKLQAKVDAVNLANRAANEHQEKLCEYFRGLIGRKVVCADGSLTKAVKRDLPALDIENVRVHYRPGSLVCFCVNGSACCGEYWVYHDEFIDIGRLDGDTLADVLTPIRRRDDYTVEEVERKRREFERAKEVYGDARAALIPFGEY